MTPASQASLTQAVRALQTTAGMIRADTADVLATRDHVQLVTHFDQLRQSNDLIKEARESLSEIADLLSTRDIPDLFKELKVKTTTIVGVGRVTVSYRFSCSMLDKEQGMEWLKANGHGGLIQPTVNAQTLGAFAKNLIETEGKELPENLFKTGQSPYTSITKVK